MTSGEGGGTRVLGSLRSAGGSGVVRIEDRLDAGVEAVWSAISDPQRLAQWHGKIEGDLRPGGRFNIYLEADDWRGTGRIEVCEPLRRLVVTTRESDESWRKGQGDPPFDKVLDVTLTDADEQTDLVIEVQQLPPDKVAFYGAGWQIHVENLAAHLAGREPVDSEARWDELVPAYQDLAGRMD